MEDLIKIEVNVKLDLKKFEQVVKNAMSQMGSVAPKAAAPTEKTAEATDEKPKKVKVKKEEPKVEAKEEVSEDDFDSDFGDASSDAEPEITPELLRTKLVEYAQKHSKEKAYSILGKYGAKKVNDLKPDKFQKVYNELQAGA